MASIVTLKTDGLSEAAAKAAALKTDMDSIYAQLQKLEDRLGENISALQSSTQTAQSLVFSSQKKGLSAQATRMNSVVSLLNTASGETTNSTNKLTNYSRQFQLAVGTMSASSVAATTVAAGVTASSVAVTSVFGGNWLSSFWTSLTDWLVGVGQTVGEKIVAAEKEAQKEKQGDTDCEDNGQTKPTAVVNSGGYSSPLPGKNLKVTSPYYRNDSGKYHGGVDFQAAEGTPLAAIQGGKVLFAGVEKLADGSPAAGGNCILIQGTDGYYYYYAHLKKIDVKVGDTIPSGELIGETGKSTGTIEGMTAHLHVNIAIPKGSDITVPAGSGINGTGAAEWFGNHQAITIDPEKFLKEKGVL